MDGWNDGDMACFGGIEGLKPVETGNRAGVWILRSIKRVQGGRTLQYTGGAIVLYYPRSSRINLTLRSISLPSHVQTTAVPTTKQTQGSQKAQIQSGTFPDRQTRSTSQFSALRRNE